MMNVVVLFFMKVDVVTISGLLYITLGFWNVDLPAGLANDFVSLTMLIHKIKPYKKACINKIQWAKEIIKKS